MAAEIRRTTVIVLGKTLVLTADSTDWTSRQMMLTGLVTVDRIYRPVTKLQKKLRSLHYHLNGDKSFWYADWKMRIKEYNTVILYDSFLGSDVAEFIEKEAPETRLIVFYANPWFNNYYLSDEARRKCEIWSFDLDDCKKYGLKYNHNFFFYNPVLETKTNPNYASDVFFVGKDKRRLQVLMKLETEIRQEGLKPFFYVKGERRDVFGKKIKYTSQEKAFVQKSNLTYESVLEYNKVTKCILEIMQPGQTGVTLRTVEAMFFNKKLITDNLAIMQYDFYSPKNIYILNHESRKLSDFIQDNEFSGWDPKFIKSYSFEHWLQVFNAGNSR